MRKLANRYNSGETTTTTTTTEDITIDEGGPTIEDNTSNKRGNGSSRAHEHEIAISFLLAALALFARANCWGTGV